MKKTEITLTEDQLDVLSSKIAEKLMVFMKKNEDENIKRKINQSVVERPGISFKVS